MNEIDMKMNYFQYQKMNQSHLKKLYLDIPKYVTVEYDMMLWCDFTTQLNDLIDQILPYNRFAWGNEGNKFLLHIWSINFETLIQLEKIV
jgi:hypothetical protein